MASYQNLSSLAGLSAGDVITYNTNASIDLAGSTVTISMVGYRNQSSGGKGGWISFDFDSSNLSSNLYFRAGQHTALCYEATNFDPSNQSTFEYYRIAVPGDTGYPSKDSNNATIKGGGGGLASMDTSQAAGNGNDATTAGLAKGRGASITAGGKGYSAGSFGAGGTNDLQVSQFCGHGGYGWYGGGAGQSNGTNSASGGGGSCFVLASSTYNSVPSGYMDGNIGLILDLANRASNVQCTRSNSVSQAMGTMVITIVSTGSDTPTLSNLSWSVTPTKTTYNYQSGATTPFDITGAVVVAVYSDSSTINVTNSVSVSTIDLGITGTQTGYVYYDGLSLGYDITVVSSYVTSLTLSGNYPTQFAVNDTFSSSGLVVTANYSDGTSAVTNNFSVSGANTSSTGRKTVNVTYTGSDISGSVPSTNYNITVVDYVQYVYVAPRPRAYDYIQDDILVASNVADREYNHSQGVVTAVLMAHCSSGADRQVGITSASNLDFTTLGPQTYTYSYSGSTYYPIDPSLTAPLTATHTFNIVTSLPGVYRYDMYNLSDWDDVRVYEKIGYLPSYYNNNDWNDCEAYYYNNNNTFDKGTITIEPYTYTNTNVTCNAGTVTPITDENQVVTGYQWVLPAGVDIDASYARLYIEFEGSFPPGEYDFRASIQNSKDPVVSLYDEMASVYSTYYHVVESITGYQGCRSYGMFLQNNQTMTKRIYVPSVLYRDDYGSESDTYIGDFETTPPSKIRWYMAFKSDYDAPQNDIIVTINDIRPIKYS